MRACMPQHVPACAWPQPLPPPSPQSVHWDPVVVTGDAPCARSGHSFTAVGDAFLVFGGCGRQNGEQQQQQQQGSLQ